MPDLPFVLSQIRMRRLPRAVPPNERAAMTDRPLISDPDTRRFEIHRQGLRETVFFTIQPR